jgi:hypothetical protein
MKMKCPAGAHLLQDTTLLHLHPKAIGDSLNPLPTG